MLQKNEELASIEHQRKINKIHQEFSQKISQEKRSQSKLEKNLLGLKDSYKEKEREKKELLRQLHEARMRASMLQVFVDLWVKSSMFVFLLFRTLSWFLPDWIVCRLESYTGYIRYAHLQNRQLVVEQKRKKELVKIQTNYEKKLKVEKKKTLELQKEIKEVWEEKHKKIDQELLNLREELRRIQLAAR